MTPKQLHHLMKSRAILSGIVSGIMIALGLAFLLLGFLGIALREEGIGLMALIFGASFIVLSADMSLSHLQGKQ